MVLAAIGSRFDPGLLETLGIERAENLVVAELVDQVRFTRGPEYTAKWRERLATRGISYGPTPCHDRGGPACVRQVRRVV
jgi:hypothetical protein